MDRRTSSTAFTISFDEQDQTAQNGPETSPGTELETENGHREEASTTRHHDVLAWEVEFTDHGSGGGDGGSQKTKKMPRFLRERERARQARMEKMKDYEDTCLTSPQASSKKGMRSTSAPQQAGKSKIPTPNKASTEDRQQTVPPRPASVASLSTQKIKRSPAIKQPLLLVQSSPQSRTQERKALSATNSPLTGRTRLTKPVARPSSAKTAREMKNKQDKSSAIEFNSPPAPKKGEKVSKYKEVTHLKPKKVRITY